jgi:hypothetical protein
MNSYHQSFKYDFTILILILALYRQINDPSADHY